MLLLLVLVINKYGLFVYKKDVSIFQQSSQVYFYDIVYKVSSYKKWSVNLVSISELYIFFKISSFLGKNRVNVEK
jgi:hypothetical protein